MDFQPKEDKHYRIWLATPNGAFFIGVADYLFDMKCVQVLFRESPTATDRYVIQEWRTYKPELVDVLIEEIKASLSRLGATFGQWKEVENLLPPKEAKYLEDEVWIDSIEEDEEGL